MPQQDTRAYSFILTYQTRARARRPLRPGVQCSASWPSPRIASAWARSRTAWARRLGSRFACPAQGGIRCVDGYVNLSAPGKQDAKLIVAFFHVSASPRADLPLVLRISEAYLCRRFMAASIVRTMSAVFRRPFPSRCQGRAWVSHVIEACDMRGRRQAEALLKAILIGR